MIQYVIFYHVNFRCVCIFECALEKTGSVCFCTPLYYVLCIVHLSALLVQFDLLTHLLGSFKLLTDAASLSR